MSKHLLLKNGRLYFRRRIPTRLVAHLGSSDFVCVLPPCNHHAAVKMARKLSCRLDLFFAEAMTDNTLDRPRIHELARQTFTEFFQEYERANRRLGSERGDEINARRVEGARELARRMLWEDAAATADIVLAEQGLAIEIGSDEHVELCEKLVRANSEAVRIAAARHSGDYTAVPADPLFAGCALDRPPSSTLASVYQKYCADRQKGDHWRSDAIRENKNTFELLTQVLGEKPISLVTRREIAQFLDMVRMLPRKRGKSNALRQLSLPELIERVKAGELDPISPTTVGKHMKNVVSFFKWAVRQGEIRENPADGVYQPNKRTRSESEERNKWSNDQLKKLFSSPIYHGCKGPTRRFQAGGVVIKDAWYWLPLFMAFHPVRPEEIAQLHLSDVVEQDGTLLIDINGGVTAEAAKRLGKQIKTTASKRQIPVHSIMLELGFPAYLRSISDAGHERLFPDLSQAGGTARFSQYICKRLNAKLPGMGIEGVEFYGLRHSAVTALNNACGHDSLTKRLQGHVLAGETRRYVKGFEVSHMKAAIEGIQYAGIDAEFIRGRAN